MRRADTLPSLGSSSSSCTGSALSSSLSLDEDALLRRLERRRLRQTEADYTAYCIMLCRTGRLREHGRLRAMVWRDVVLGRRPPPAVPQLSDGIIGQLQSRAHSHARHRATHHSREDTRMSDSLSSFTSPTAERAEGPAEHDIHDDTADDAADHLLTEWRAPAVLSERPDPHAACPRRHRHASVQQQRSAPPIAPAEDGAGVAPAAGGGGGGGNPPVRRRAVSQLSHRVKGDAEALVQLARDVAGSTAALEQLEGSSAPYPMSWYRLPDNCQLRVVEADIARSLWTLYPQPAERAERRWQLKNMLLRVLLHNPEQYYYQGLHELMGYVMHTLIPYMDREEVVSVCEGILMTRWRRFCTQQLKNSEAMLYAMHAVVAQEDPPLAAALEWCGVGPESHYAVSWVITWFVHSTDSVAVLARLFDYFIADATGSAVIFVGAALVVSQRDVILGWILAAKGETAEAGDTAGAGEDGVVLMARVYSQLSRLPTRVFESIDEDGLGALIAQAARYSAVHTRTAEEEEQNFISGNVQKLGMLSNQRTRNAALRLLWRLLPREWRSPAKVQHVRRMMLWTGLMAAATAVVVGTAAVNAKSHAWMGGLLRR
ncbi:TBC1 domain family member 20/GTPase [Novymonas esmeraldas]|uniref:TBC1 domain family member 20/GTPase n=1 Tax=Novymonas esmeraldas TaxID=1808958 RepID=A0AAW0EWA5_9TRYP